MQFLLFPASSNISFDIHCSYGFLYKVVNNCHKMIANSSVQQNIQKPDILQVSSFACWAEQQRQSGLKSGESWIRSQKFPISSLTNFDFQEKLSHFQKQILIFQPKHFDDFFSHELKKFAHFSPKNVINNHLHLLSVQIYLLFLKTTHFSTYFLCQIHYYNISKALHGALRPLYDPSRPPTQNLGW